MSERSDFVSLEVSGERIDTWTKYTVDSDLLTDADAFHLTVELGGRGDDFKDEFLRATRLLRENAACQLFIGADVHGGARTRALQLTGYIDRARISVTRERGAVIEVTGRDKAGVLGDSAASPSLIREASAGATFADVARAAVAPWSIQVISDQSAARTILTGAAGLTPEQRLRVEQARAQGIDARFMTQHIMREAQRVGRPIDEYTGTSASARARRRSSSGRVGSDVERERIGEAAPHPGESIWGFLHRHAERLHIQMWMSPDGKLILGTPDYSQPSRYRFVRRFTNDPTDPNNFSDGTAERDGSELFSKVTVYGHTRSRDERRSPFRAVVKNDTVPFRRTKIVQQQDVSSQEEAEAAAHRVMREGIAMSEVLTVDADDHGQGRYLYAIDTMADVVDEYSEIDGPRYVIGRTFERTRDRGTRTQLKLIQPDSLTL